MDRETLMQIKNSPALVRYPSGAPNRTAYFFVYDSLQPRDSAISVREHGGGFNSQVQN